MYFTTEIDGEQYEVFSAGERLFDSEGEQGFAIHHDRREILISNQVPVHLRPIAVALAVNQAWRDRGRARSTLFPFRIVEMGA
jgi:hypothetical protein